jgi:hypothetical protein
MAPKLLYTFQGIRERPIAVDIVQSKSEENGMHSIFYIIGVIVVVIFILSFLGVW